MSKFVRPPSNFVRQPSNFVRHNELCRTSMMLFPSQHLGHMAELRAAVVADDVEKLQLLLSEGADVSDQDEVGGVVVSQTPTTTATIRIKWHQPSYDRSTARLLCGWRVATTIFES